MSSEHKIVGGWNGQIISLKFHNGAHSQRPAFHLVVSTADEAVKKTFSEESFLEKGNKIKYL